MRIQFSRVLFATQQLALLSHGKSQTHTPAIRRPAEDQLPDAIS
jgi:hypothetical protein